jgi:hypothetical protein
LTLQEAVEGTYTYSVSGTNANGTGPSSAASNSVVVASVDPSAYFPIATTTLAAAAANVTFSSIPQTYKHLQIRMSVACTASYYDADVAVRFNGNATNYYNSRMYATIGSVTGDKSAALQGLVARAGGAANIFGPAVVDILDYTSTNKNKTFKSLYGQSVGSSGYWMFNGGGWFDTAAITSITIAEANFSIANLAPNSTFTLYGIKG